MSDQFATDTDDFNVEAFQLDRDDLRILSLTDQVVEGREESSLSTQTHFVYSPPEWSESFSATFMSDSSEFSKRVKKRKRSAEKAAESAAENEQKGHTLVIYPQGIKVQVVDGPVSNVSKMLNRMNTSITNPFDMALMAFLHYPNLSADNKKAFDNFLTSPRKLLDLAKGILQKS
jgi:hypothetical protein